MSVQHRLQNGDGICLGRPDRGLQHHGLVELVGSAEAVQPSNDRSGRQRADTIVGKTAVGLQVVMYWARIRWMVPLNGNGALS